MAQINGGRFAFVMLICHKFVILFILGYIFI